MKIDILKSFRYKLLLSLILLLNRFAYSLLIYSRFIDNSKLNLRYRKDILLKMNMFTDPSQDNISKYINWQRYLFECGWSATDEKAQLSRFRTLQKSISENGLLTDDINAITATWVLIVVYITPDQKISFGFNSYLLREGAHRLAYTLSKNENYRNIKLVKPTEYVYPSFIELTRGV